jgi:hypothetical protein
MEDESRWKIFMTAFGWSFLSFAFLSFFAMIGLEVLNGGTTPDHTRGMHWGAVLTIFVVWPFIYAWSEHGRQTMAQKHRNAWNRAERTEGHMRMFTETFRGHNVGAVMETLREKRLKLLSQVEAIAAEHPESSDEKGASRYFARVQGGIEAVKAAGQDIRDARNLAVETFGLNLPPAEYFMGPRPSDTPQGSADMAAEVIAGHEEGGAR